MGAKFIQPSFAAGEVAPGLYARVDLAKYRVGLAKCRNMFVHAYGGVSNRPGTVFVGEALGESRLVPFIFSTTQTYMLEFSNLKMRVIIDGGYVVYPVGHASAGQIVEVTSPYPLSALPDLRWAQSADTIFFAHPGYKPRALTRTDHHLWTFSEVSFAPTMAAPTGLAGSYDGTVTSSRTIKYVVAAVSAAGEESLPSSEISVSVNATWESGKKVSLSWTAVSGADYYVVYKDSRGYFGFIGTARSTSYTDDYVSPEVTDGPKVNRTPFEAAGDYPGTVGLYEQRLWYGRTNNKPQSVWSSQSGNIYNFGVSRPLKDDDAIQATLVSRQVNEIRHFIPLEKLIIMTSDSEWALTSAAGANGGLSPTSLQFRTQGYRGCSTVPPIVVGNVVLFLQPDGSVVRELAYTYETDSYKGPNLSVLAGHLFDGYSITEWAYQQFPDSIVWAVRSDGKLLGFTYLKEHEVWAWHLHETDGEVESVASIPGVGRDEVYFVVKRTIDGQTVRYVEMLAERMEPGDVTTAFFVDCGLSYYGTPATVLSGLGHLEGKDVAVLADGNVVPDMTVASGSITIPYPASVVHIGLPFTSTLGTLDLEFDAGQGTIQGKRKRVGTLTVRFEDSRGAWAGPTETDMTEMKFRTSEGYNEPTRLFTGDKDILMTPKWSRQGRVFIQQRDPLPLTVLAVIPEIDLGT